MSRFGPDPLAFFDAVYREPAPWDVGEAQPALTSLFIEYPPAGPVLDVGCGSGDLALALARRGLPVLGVDFVEAAIAQARAKARTLPPGVRDLLDFRVADALRPASLARELGAVVDSGFLHLFDTEERNHFAAELAAALRPGGRYYLLAFAVTFPVPNSPLAVTEEELRSRFTHAEGWLIRTCRSAEFQSRLGPVPATCACMERCGSGVDWTIRQARAT
jgi:SAM-dependent methyltransferase